MTACLVPLLLISTRCLAFPSSNPKQVSKDHGLQLLKRYYQENIGYPDLANPDPSPYRLDGTIEQDAREIRTHYVFWTEVDNRQGQTIAAEFARQNDGQTAADTWGENYICEIGGQAGEDWWPNYVDRVSGIFADQAGRLHNERGVRQLTIKIYLQVLS